MTHAGWGLLGHDSGADCRCHSRSVFDASGYLLQFHLLSNQQIKRDCRTWSNGARLLPYALPRTTANQGFSRCLPE
jgi:hypothetical protein